MLKIVRKFETVEEMCEERDKFHLAMVGTPAYINSEVALCETGLKEFTLIIGYRNKDDYDVEVGVTNA